MQASRAFSTEAEPSGIHMVNHMRLREESRGEDCIAQTHKQTHTFTTKPDVEHAQHHGKKHSSFLGNAHFVRYKSQWSGELRVKASVMITVARAEATLQNVTMAADPLLSTLVTNWFTQAIARMELS